jgi:hypothetical protein
MVAGWWGRGAFARVKNHRFAFWAFAPAVADRLFFAAPQWRRK